MSPTEWHFLLLDCIFLSIYVVEALLKIIALGFAYFGDFWNNLGEWRWGRLRMQEARAKVSWPAKGTGTSAPHRLLHHDGGGTGLHPHADQLPLPLLLQSKPLPDPQSLEEHARSQGHPGPAEAPVSQSPQGGGVGVLA